MFVFLNLVTHSKEYLVTHPPFASLKAQPVQCCLAGGWGWGRGVDSACKFLLLHPNSCFLVLFVVVVPKLLWNLLGRLNFCNFSLICECLPRSVLQVFSQPQ